MEMNNGSAQEELWGEHSQAGTQGHKTYYFFRLLRTQRSGESAFAGPAQRHGIAQFELR
jgi:hypothetical protein